MLLLEVLSHSLLRIAMVMIQLKKRNVIKQMMIVNQKREKWF